MNPLLSLRNTLGIPQSRLASRASVTEQYIRRQEQGTVSNVSGSLIRALYDEAALSGRLPELVAALKQGYLSLVYEFSLATPNNNTIVIDSYQRFEQVVIDWCHLWRTACRRQVTYKAISKCNSVYGLCRLLVLHPYIVQQYAKHFDTLRLPAEIDLALEESDITQRAFVATLSRIRIQGARNV